MIWLWIGCATVDTTFAFDRANAICERHATCGTLGDAGYASEEACRASLRQAADDLLRDEGQACETWDAQAAADCLAVYEGACDLPLDFSACTRVCGGG